MNLNKQTLLTELARLVDENDSFEQRKAHRVRQYAKRGMMARAWEEMVDFFYLRGLEDFAAQNGYTSGTQATAAYMEQQGLPVHRVYTKGVLFGVTLDFEKIED